MSTAPLLATLLGGALPGLRALDLGLPAPVLFPWLPGTICGVADPASLPPAEAALLRRFRHPDGRPLLGFDGAADGALLAGAPVAWNHAPDRLIRLAAPAPCDPPPDALLLVPPDAEIAACAPKGRILLLLGAGGGVERHDLLVPLPRLEAMHAMLHAAAEAFARAASGRWLARSLAVSAGLASVALLPEDAGASQPPVSLPASALVHDLPVSAGPDGLDWAETRRVRLLLGTTPARLRVFLRGDASGAVLFAEGRRVPAAASACTTGETCLEAAPPPGAEPAIIGLAVPQATRLALTRLELLPP